MPYIDQGDPEPRNLPWVAVVVVAVISPVFWYASFNWFGMSYPGAILAGLAIGLAGKFTLKSDYPPLRIAALVLAVLSGFVGYVWIDSMLLTPFDFGLTTTRFFKDFMALLMVGFGAYLAFVLATPRGGGPPNPRT